MPTDIYIPLFPVYDPGTTQVTKGPYYKYDELAYGDIYYIPTLENFIVKPPPDWDARFDQPFTPYTKVTD